ncbi:MAG: hypothetical protein PVH00_01315 [Gemmatimonadota bacterium]|jgi:hypothetical protein
MSPLFRKSKLPSKNDAWTALAERRSGTPVTDRKGRVKQVRFRLDTFELVLDSYTVSTGNSSQTYTRIRSLFNVREEFRFRMYRASLFSELGKFFGMQDIEVGHPKLDPDFVIKADSPGKIQSMLLQSDIADALMTLGTGRFESRPFKRRGVDTTNVRELRYALPGVLREAAKLDALIDLMEESLEHLVRNGSAWTEPPDVAL